MMPAEPTRKTPSTGRRSTLLQLREAAMQEDGSVVVAQDTILNRIRGEFREMPGLRLKREQAQRLFCLDEAQCQRLLDTLVQAGFLARSPDGLYGLPSAVAGFSPLPVAKVTLAVNALVAKSHNAA